jgi:hypothetical protein
MRLNKFLIVSATYSVEEVENLVVGNVRVCVNGKNAN